MSCFEFHGLRREHIQKFLSYAAENRFILHFLIKESLLGETPAKQLMEKLMNAHDVQGTAALLQYLKENFGGDGTEGFSI